MKYFKEKETFDMDEFADEVISNPKATNLLRPLRTSTRMVWIRRSMILSRYQQRGKEAGRVYKSVLKLDKNFHI